MEINEIKRQLSILTVLAKYNLKPDKNNLLKCPFHNDKTASLQVYPKTNSFYCFACGATGDQIEFIEKYEKLDKPPLARICNPCFNHEVELGRYRFLII